MIFFSGLRRSDWSCGCKQNIWYWSDTPDHCLCLTTTRYQSHVDTSYSSSIHQCLSYFMSWHQQFVSTSSSQSRVLKMCKGIFFPNEQPSSSVQSLSIFVTSVKNRKINHLSNPLPAFQYSNLAGFQLWPQHKLDNTGNLRVTSRGAVSARRHGDNREDCCSCNEGFIVSNASESISHVLKQYTDSEMALKTYSARPAQ